MDRRAAREPAAPFLTRAERQGAIDARTLTNRISARDEAHALLAILKYAQGNDIEFPASLLTIAVPKKTKINKRLRQKDGRALVSELDTIPTTLFDRVTLHTLRRTAVSWLRASQLPVEIIAQRLGHSDGGATLLAHYTAEARSGQMRAALDALGPGVRSRLRELETPLTRTQIAEDGAPSEQWEPASTRPIRRS